MANLFVLVALMSQYLETLQALCITSHVGWVLSSYLSRTVEGLRVSQIASCLLTMPFTVNYFILAALQSTFFNPFCPSSICTSIVAAIFLLHNIFFALKIGTGGFSHLRLEGQYEVGVRYLKT